MDKAARAAGQSIMGFLPNLKMRRPQIRVPAMKKTEDPMMTREALAVERLNRSL